MNVSDEFKNCKQDFCKALTIDKEKIKDFWMPDLYIYNLKQIENLDVLEKRGGVKLFGNKTIRYAFSTKTIIGCEFHYQNYPFDSQSCDFTVGSYGYSSKELIFNGEFHHVIENEKPLQLINKLCKR